jgi:hypothetical protein
MQEQKLNKECTEAKTNNNKIIYTQEEVAEICKNRLKLMKESSKDFIDNPLEFKNNLRKE